MKKYDIRNPDTGNVVTEPVQFNLMFASSIGPTGQHPGFLRPETAQGHFLNFSRLLDFNNGRLPFASAQIGRSFRNEISPRAGLLRVREFTMAEIEHYVDPADKSHPRFAEVRDVVVGLLDRDTQSGGHTTVRQMSIGDAVSQGVIANETLGYFVARIYAFLTKIGINEKRLRFRQHMANEMAHYATDCWDAEIQNSYGWTECVGCADRAAYDLTVHAKKTGASLVVREALKEPIVTEKIVAELNKKKMGKAFGKDIALLQKMFDECEQTQLEKLMGELAQGCVSSPSQTSDTRFRGCVACCVSDDTMGPALGSKPSLLSPLSSCRSARQISIRFAVSMDARAAYTPASLHHGRVPGTGLGDLDAIEVRLSSPDCTRHASCGPSTLTPHWYMDR